MHHSPPWPHYCSLELDIINWLVSIAVDFQLPSNQVWISEIRISEVPLYSSSVCNCLLFEQLFICPDEGQCNLAETSVLNYFCFYFENN